MPMLVRWYFEYSFRSFDIYPAILAVLYVMGIPGYGVLISLELLLCNLRRGVVFEQKNVRLLRIISWCCAGVSLAFLLLGTAHLFALLIGIAAAFFGLILRVLKNVFEQAIRIKQENVFTI